MNNEIKTKTINGEVLIDVESFAIGLGISQIAKSGNVSVIWNRVNKYLNRTKLNKVSKGDYINKREASLILSRIRNARSYHIAELIGIDVLNTTIPSIEQDVLSKIIKSFPNEKIALQKTILGSYKIDLYFTDYNLAIEVDEFGHSDRDKDYDSNREKYVLEHTNVNKFIRINPDAPDYDIFKSIGEINNYLCN